MKEYPIIFSSEMVKAILEDRKTATRRMSDRWGKVKAGDVLWVKEAWAIYDCGRKVSLEKETWPEGWPIKRLRYLATDKAPNKQGYWWNKRSAIFMPRWASRITFEVTKDAYKQKLWNMTGKEAKAEGIERGPYPADLPYPFIEYIRSFTTLWDSINGKKYPWSSNPEPWVIEFRRIICQMIR